jgi:hypothetical protein
MPPKGSTVPNYPKNRKSRPLKNDLTNRKFGRLTVVKRIFSLRNGSVLWDCLCDCGKTVRASTRHLNRKNNTVKSCGCLKLLYGKDHKDWNGIGEISGKWWCQHITREFKQKSRAKIKVTIDKQYAWDLFLKQNRKCALTGIELQIGNSFDKNTASIDRIDSSKGYEPNNIQWVHKDINMMKNKYDVNYFISMCKLVSINSNIWCLPFQINHG